MRRVTIIVFLSVAAALLAIPGPIPPTAPTAPVFTNSSSSGTTNGHPGKTPPPVPSQVLKVRLFRADGRAVTGEIRVPGTPLVVRHRVEGADYTRTIHFSRIRSLRILSWRGMEYSDDEGVRLFFFTPAVWAISTGKGAPLVYRERLPAFERLVVSNNHGQTVLFSYFADYWMAAKKGGYWRNSGSPVFTTVRTVALSGCVVRMEVLAEKR
jgi:hypothetical protein